VAIHSFALLRRLRFAYTRNRIPDDWCERNQQTKAYRYGEPGYDGDAHYFFFPAIFLGCISEMVNGYITKPALKANRRLTVGFNTQSSGKLKGLWAGDGRRTS
jgi:hypothetical protein